MQDFVAARHQMTTQQIRAWSVLDDEAMEVFDRLPREQFVPPQHRGLAYADTALPLPCGQHMLQPSVVGRILHAVRPQRHDSVLEIGTGSGYATACLALLSARVRSLEIHGELAQQARANLHATGIGNVEVIEQDAFSPDALAGAWDIIVLTGSLPLYDARFEALLQPGGRLFVICGKPPVMEARLIGRTASGAVSQVSLFETLSSPLIHAPRVDPFRF